MQLASALYTSDALQYVTAMDGLLDNLRAAITKGWQGPMVVCLVLGPSIHRPKELYVVRFCSPQGIPWNVSCAGEKCISGKCVLALAYNHILNCDEGCAIFRCIHLTPHVYFVPTNCYSGNYAQPHR